MAGDDHADNRNHHCRAHDEHHSQLQITHRLRAAVVHDAEQDDEEQRQCHFTEIDVIAGYRVQIPVREHAREDIRCQHRQCCRVQRHDSQIT